MTTEANEAHLVPDDDWPDITQMGTNGCRRPDLSSLDALVLSAAVSIFQIPAAEAARQMGLPPRHAHKIACGERWGSVQPVVRALQDRAASRRGGLPVPGCPYAVAKLTALEDADHGAGAQEHPPREWADRSEFVEGIRLGVDVGRSAAVNGVYAAMHDALGEQLNLGPCEPWDRDAAYENACHGLADRFETLMHAEVEAAVEAISPEEFAKTAREVKP